MAESAVKTPWHFWVVGVVSLLWNVCNAYGYYLVQLEHYTHMAAWAAAAWATSVWGALLGSIVLLLRSKWAFHVLAVSFAAGALYTAFGVLKVGAGGPFAIIMGVTVIVSLFFVWYARVAAKRGILR